jgi:hypothetical protein
VSKKNDLVGLLFGGSGAERSRSGAEPERATLSYKHNTGRGPPWLAFTFLLFLFYFTNLAHLTIAFLIV